MDTRAYRDTIGQFATGVTVVTSNVDGQLHGMTAKLLLPAQDVMAHRITPALLALDIADYAGTNATLLFFFILIVQIAFAAAGWKFVRATIHAAFARNQAADDVDS